VCGLLVGKFTQSQTRPWVENEFKGWVQHTLLIEPNLLSGTNTLPQ
jgi:hypothetical protein